MTSNASSKGNAIRKSIAYGLVASLLLLGLYFLVLTLVSGSSFTQKQFATYWYFIISLVVGFGIQVSLYTYLKVLIASDQGTAKVVGITGTTSTAAMISCCAHYLTNILPILGATGLATFVTQYQVQLFWVGLAFNGLGIIYISRIVIKVNRL